MDSGSIPRATSEDVFLMISRIILGSVFLYAGALKGFDLGGTIADFQALGLPFARQAAMLAVLVQVIGGTGVVLGWRVEGVAGALAALTVLAILGGRHDWMLGGGAPLHAAVIGGFVALALRGPGRLSYDWARALQQKS